MPRYAFACWHWTAATIKAAAFYAAEHGDTQLIVAWQPANRPRTPELTEAFEKMTKLFKAVSFVNVPLYSWAVNSALAWRTIEPPLRGHPLIKPHVVSPDLNLQGKEFIARLDNMRKVLAQRSDPRPSQRLEAYLKAFCELTPRTYREGEYVEWLRQFFVLPPNEPGRLHADCILELLGLTNDEALACAREIAAMQTDAEGKPLTPGASSVRWLGKLITPIAGCKSDALNLIHAFNSTTAPSEKAAAMAAADVPLTSPYHAVAAERELCAMVQHASLIQFPGLEALFMDAEHDDIRVECMVGPAVPVWLQANTTTWERIRAFHPRAQWVEDADARNASVVLQAHGLQ